jgi:hypothetical protein
VAVAVAVTLLNITPLIDADLTLVVVVLVLVVDLSTHTHLLHRWHTCKAVTVASLVAAAELVNITKAVLAVMLVVVDVLDMDIIQITIRIMDGEEMVSSSFNTQSSFNIKRRF